MEPSPVFKTKKVLDLPGWMFAFLDSPDGKISSMFFCSLVPLIR
ncbi:hypothetical protein CWATWH8502_588 [Crocosphaera watsonii WH 8502]|uniref:Uncharacterized protein n=5 Tax=Crocosphaera watsonii TaxID=263511 RepID=T2JZW4_CROWT|nr:hypothetical protein CWATWH0003_0210 [Crocosphaera watsonii WH 0003]CCQ50729.1 hypothetical protein CWATWH8502_588 [Crocosphaera watsonii WH 8502]CCQ55427.1 hypothetical protein CWATWH0005_1531 [Crocosphaera watsonii WH 0005]CCQ60183.1 hypothetical protein CWATWH0401_819 [Crocosphaera watsonii WH 0401]CCQ70689.1 hypothetical protein CWATWH0402_1236 [Crocosphaera watsonii WH 0402]